MAFLTRSLPEVGILYGSGLFDGDEQCFEYGQTYEVHLAKVPRGLDPGKAAVIYRNGVIYGWLKKVKATASQLEAFEKVFDNLRYGNIVKVTITSAGNLSEPKYDDRIAGYREWCSGTGRCSVETDPGSVFNVSAKTLVGQVEICFGSKLYSAGQEAPFVHGARYLLKQERVPVLGGYGTALKQEDPARHSGYVNRHSNEVVESYLRRGKRVVAEVTSASEGEKGKRDRRLRTERDWWNGRALCWVHERCLDLSSNIWDSDDEEGLPDLGDEESLSDEDDE